MIEDIQYIETVTTYFNFLITEFDFKLLEKKTIGNAFYDIKYKDKNKKRIVSISYENIEDYLLVIIFILENGELPDYDDKTKTLHLNRLNEIILANIDKTEINLNNEFFSRFNAKNEIEKKLLKSAKELRLCLKNFDKLLILS
jgi:hypothetical protein